MKKTLEAGVYVVEQGPERVVFWDSRTGARWAQLGSCDCRGLCEYGANPFPEQDLDWDGVVGHPCRDCNYGNRPEIPTTSQWKEHSRRMARALGLDIECGYEFVDA